MTSFQKQQPFSTKRLLKWCAKEGIAVVLLYRTINGACSCGDPSCDRPGKHPISTPSWNPQPAEFIRFLNENPNARIAIALGQNVVALQTRGPTGRQNLRELRTGQKVLPATVTIRKGDRKIRLFKVNGIGVRGARLAEHVRLLGQGDFVLLPLSTDFGEQALLREGRRTR